MLWIIKTRLITYAAFAGILFFQIGCTSRPTASIVKENELDSRIVIETPGQMVYGLIPQTIDRVCSISVKSSLLYSDRPISAAEFNSTQGFPIGDKIDKLSGFVFYDSRKKVIVVGISLIRENPSDGKVIYVPFLANEMDCPAPNH